MKIRLPDIRVDETIQGRAELTSREVVDDYADALRRGDQFPPVIVFKDAAGVFWLADGFHRYRAHEQLGSEYIEAEVRKGEYRDARLFANTEANRANSARLTRADKRKRVATLLGDDEWRGWANSAIGKKCGVDAHTVKSIRETLGISQDGPVVFERRGKTHEMNVENIRKRSPLRDAVEFVKGAVAKKDYMPALTYFHIAQGRILAYDGTVALSSPIDLDLSCRPKADQFIETVNALGEPLEVKQLRSGMLELSRGGSSRTVGTTAKKVENLAPEGETYDVAGDDLLDTFKRLALFISQDATRKWMRGVLLNDTCAYATNGAVLVERTVSQAFPVTVNIPEEAVEQVLRLKEPPTRVQTDARTTITFHYPGDRWLRTGLLPANWPRLPLVPTDHCVPVPEGFFDALKRLEGAESVYFHEGCMTTCSDLEHEVGARESLPGIGDWGRFDIRHLLSLSGVAKFFDLSVYPELCPFHDGNRLRGLIAGLNAYPEPSEATTLPSLPTPALDELVSKFRLERVGDTARITDNDAGRILGMEGYPEVRPLPPWLNTSPGTS